MSPCDRTVGLVTHELLDAEMRLNYHLFDDTCILTTNGYD